jgi:type VI protein secretion system component VasF
MTFMWLPKHVNEQDRRALTLYFVVALLTAACLVLVILYKSDLHVRKKAALESLPAPGATPTPRNRP